MYQGSLFVSRQLQNVLDRVVVRYMDIFTLLADLNHQAAEDYGVWKEKSMYGKNYMGVERTTFVIDPAGKIKKIFRKVKVDGHAEDVFAAIE